MRLMAEKRREQERLRLRQKDAEEEKRRQRVKKEEEVYRSMQTRSPPRTASAARGTSPTHMVPRTAFVTRSSTSPTPSGTTSPVRSSPAPATLAHAYSRSAGPPPNADPAPGPAGHRPRDPYPVATPYAVTSPFMYPSGAGAPAGPARAGPASAVPEAAAWHIPAGGRDSRGTSDVRESRGPLRRSSGGAEKSKGPDEGRMQTRTRSQPGNSSPEAARPQTRAHSAEPLVARGARSKSPKPAAGELLCNLSVGVRFRPPPPRDENREVCWLANGNTVSTRWPPPHFIPPRPGHPCCLWVLALRVVFWLGVRIHDVLGDPSGRDPGFEESGIFPIFKDQPYPTPSPQLPSMRCARQ